MMDLTYYKMLLLLVLYDGLDQDHRQGLHQVQAQDQGLLDKALKLGKIFLIYH